MFWVESMVLIRAPLAFGSGFSIMFSPLIRLLWLLTSCWLHDRHLCKIIFISEYVNNSISKWPTVEVVDQIPFGCILMWISISMKSDCRKHQNPRGGVCSGMGFSQFFWEIWSDTVRQIPHSPLLPRGCWILEWQQFREDSEPQNFGVLYPNVILLLLLSWLIKAWSQNPIPSGDKEVVVIVVDFHWQG